MLGIFLSDTTCNQRMKQYRHTGPELMCLLMYFHAYKIIIIVRIRTKTSTARGHLTGTVIECRVLVLLASRH
jgi:hypothetical protein